MAMEDVQLSENLVVPKGTFATVNVNSIHFDEVRYPDPEAFKYVVILVSLASRNS